MPFCLFLGVRWCICGELTGFNRCIWMGVPAALSGVTVDFIWTAARRAWQALSARSLRVHERAHTHCTSVDVMLCTPFLLFEGLVFSKPNRTLNRTSYSSTGPLPSHKNLEIRLRLTFLLWKSEIAQFF